MELGNWVIQCVVISSEVEKSIVLIIFCIFGLMEKIRNIISIDKETLGGQPVFKGSRVPIESLFLHLEKGISLDEFLEDFPTVSRQQVVAVLEIAGKLTTSKNLEKLYECV